jgi:hypothetical protein
MIVFIPMAAIAWHHQEPRFDRGEAQADLIEKRQQKGNAADAKTREEATAHGGAEGANAEEFQLEQREWKNPCMNSVACEQRGRQRQESGHLQGT